MNTQELSDVMLGDLPAKRERWFELFKDDAWKPTYNFKTWDATREDPFIKFK